MGTTTEATIASVRQPTRLLNRNFALLWLAQSVSVFGIQGFSVAMLFWTKHATNSATLMGLMMAFSSLPMILLGPLGGSLADRYPRRSIIILCDAVMGVAVLLLAGLMLLAPEARGLILASMLAVALVNSAILAVYGPAISAAGPDLVPKDRVTTANSLVQSTYQIAVFFGQGLGGTLFRLLGAQLLFAINGLTYLFAATSESFVSIPQRIPERTRSWEETLAAVGQDIRVGLRYVWQRGGLREMFFLSALLSFFTMPIIILLPFYVEDTLKAPVDWYGFILAAYGLGSLLGYVLAGGLKLSGRTRGPLVMGFIVALSAGYALLGLVRSPLWAVALAVIGGVGNGFVSVTITTLLQITTPGDIRGRVFGLLNTLSGSITPIATALAGVAADLMGHNIPAIYIACAAFMTVLAAGVATRQPFRAFLAFEPAPEEPAG